MTLPNERYRAIGAAREFLRDLLDPKKTPKVPKKYRERAYRVLKHYPWAYDMSQVALSNPKIFEKDE